MSTSFDSHSCAIGVLIGDTERRSIVLPKFQRGFSWEKAQVRAFWEDVALFRVRFQNNPISASYFLGPIVIQPDDEEIVLLDGQQRLATATVLLAVLRDVARTLDSPDPKTHLGSDAAHAIQSNYIQKEDLEPPQYSLVLGELDQPYFTHRIQVDAPKDTSMTPTLRSHRLIDEAYKLLHECVANHVYSMSNDIHTRVAEIKRLRDCVCKGMRVVSIQVDTEEDAFDIFASLNDRGLRLSVPDLLLNFLMQRAKTKANRAAVRTKWNYMLQEMGKRDIARFLRHMWLSKYGDLKARGLFAEMKDRLATPSLTSLSFAQDCAEECDAYISILDVGEEIPKDARDSMEGLVKHINVPASYPLLLSGLRCLSDADFVKLARFSCSLAVRHHLLANLNPADLETAFYQAAREIRGKSATGSKSRQCLAAAKKILSGINPTDSTVCERASDLVFKRTQATWLVKNIAKGMQTKTKEIGFDKANLEHIFPENAGEDWPNRKSLEPFLWHLGNLTHLGTRLNRRARNKSFNAKCKEHYTKSEIVMTQKIAKLKQWSATEVQERTRSLLKEAVKIWREP